MKGKTAIVTGGARGIGLGIAERLVRDGATVYIADIDEAAARASADALSRCGPGRAFAIGCDVSRRASVDQAVQQVLDEQEHLDVMISNAGVCPFVEFLELDNATWQKTIDVILTGSFNAGQAAARAMIQGGRGGRIVFVTSLATIKAGGDQADYAAAKSGERGLMAAMASALGLFAITVNAVAPGVIYTDMTRSRLDTPGARERFAAANPIPRFGEPADVAAAVAFLVSDDAGYITGSTIRVDGGMMNIG